MLSVGLLTWSVDSLVKFYSHVLGRDPDEHDAGQYARFNLESGGINIWAIEGFHSVLSQSRRSPVTFLEPHGTETGATMFSIQVEDAHAEFDRLSGDVDLIKALTTQSWGNTSFWFRDPDGRVVNIFSRDG